MKTFQYALIWDLCVSHTKGICFLTLRHSRLCICLYDGNFRRSCLLNMVYKLRGILNLFIICKKIPNNLKIGIYSWH